MKCSNCGKSIPDTSQACPFCFTAVERVNNAPTIENPSDIASLTTVNSTIEQTDNNELNFGNMDNTTYDDSSLETFMQESKKKRKILLPIILVLVGFVVLIVILYKMSAPRNDYYRYYTGVVDKIYEYIDENITSSNARTSGKYKYAYNINDSKGEFKGEYQFNIYKKVLNITGDLKNPEEERGGIVINDQTLTIEVYAKNNELYFISNNIYNLPILLPYEDPTGLLVTKQYDLSSLIDGVKDATNISLKAMNYEVEKGTSIDVRGSSKDCDKITLKMDYQAKRIFYSTFFNTLINDSNFISEFARINSKKSDEIEQLLNNYKTTYDYKYSVDDGKITYFNIYFKSKKIYRIEYIGEDNKKVTVDVDTNKLYVEYFENKDEKKMTLSINRMDSYMNDILTRDYVVNYKTSENDIAFTLELEKDDSVKIKSKDITDVKNIRDFNDEELNKIKTSSGIYGVDASFIDKIVELFKTKCSSDLQCVCNDENCQCTYENEIITCPLETINKKEDNQDNKENNTVDNTNGE